MAKVYSLSDSIATFLSEQSDTTQEDCDALAQSLLLSADFSPVPIQGAFSYTVAGGSQVVQFRAPESALAIDTLQRARLIYGPLVPQTTSHGQIGKERPLLVYRLERLPGITYMEYQLVRDDFQSLGEDDFRKQQGLVEDFARFFAASWQKPQAADTAAMRETIEKDLHILARTLPSRFSQDALRLIDGLDSILEDLPMALSHGDLCEMNLLVDQNSGHLSGVIDWAEAKVLPFGFSLWGLENILGYMDARGWHYFDGHAELRAAFWKVFHDSVNEDTARKQSSIDLARQMGILLRYGFGWDEDMQRNVIQGGDSSIKYLDAFFL